MPGERTNLQQVTSEPGILSPAAKGEIELLKHSMLLEIATLRLEMWKFLLCGMLALQALVMLGAATFFSLR